MSHLTFNLRETDLNCSPQKDIGVAFTNTLTQSLFPVEMNLSTIVERGKGKV